MTAPRTIDAPGTACAFQSNACTAFLLGHGGFDQHHAYPISLGGTVVQSTMLALCPSHHRRQHALIRYLVELLGDPSWAVLGHFAPVERTTALAAIDSWRADGSPPIAGWPCPAAR